MLYLTMRNRFIAQVSARMRWVWHTLLNSTQCVLQDMPRVYRVVLAGAPRRLNRNCCQWRCALWHSAQIATRCATTCNTHNTTAQQTACNMQRAACHHMQRATYKMRHTTCNIQRATYKMQHTKCGIQRATCNVQRATTCSVQHTNCDIQRATYNVLFARAGRRARPLAVVRGVQLLAVSRDVPRHVPRCGGRSALVCMGDLAARSGAAAWVPPDHEHADQGMPCRRLFDETILRMGPIQ